MPLEPDNAQKQETRRVANMTAEQVSRKRAVDRSNQRTHRAKNKAYIQHLEAKVAELTYSLEQTEAKLSRYESQAGGHHRPTQPQVDSPSSRHDSSAHHQATSQQDGYDSSIVGTNSSGNNLSVADLLPDGDGSSLPFDFGSGIAVNLFDSPSDLTFLDLGLENMQDWSGAKALEALQTAPARSSSSDTSDSGTPIWQQLPNHLPPMTKLDEIIIDKSRSWRQRFLKSARQMSELGEARFPSISSLLNQPPAEEDKVPRPVSDVVAAQVLDSPVPSLVERIAFMYKISYYIRWLVCQTEQSYYEMPDFMRPTHLQRTVPHPAWIDLLTWPEARDALINNMDWGVYETFSDLTGATVSVTWPYPDSGAFTESADGQSLRLNPMFESHIRNVNNWATGQEVADVYPYMSPYVKIRR